jgi:hypothetical protein
MSHLYAIEYGFVLVGSTENFRLDHKVYGKYIFSWAKNYLAFKKEYCIVSTQKAT